ncbi:MAG: class I SAM-dependent methyltransferase [Armatimonadetes bacterium]|nr:class I SAM-dependent methyltransferase [Armatimonadota bacterium]
MQDKTPLELWEESADAWIVDQGSEGDQSRRLILDPALETWLSGLAGKRVLDLGCGQGRYCGKMLSCGVKAVGIDPVEKFIAKAKSDYPNGEFRVGVAENLPFADDSFDAVLSYLTIIDIPDLEKAADEIARVLRPGGESRIVTISNLASTSDGWVKDDDGNRLYRTIDRYMEHFSLDLEWRGIRVRNFHRPLSYILKLFFDRGFVLTEFLEPLPPEDHIWYREEFRVPNFHIYGLRKEK